MSVASINSFALLDEDASRPSAPPQAEEASAPTQAPVTRGGPRGRGRGGPGSRGGKYYQRGNGRPRDNQAADEEPAEGAEKKFDGEGRGRGRGRGGRGRDHGEGRGEGRGGRGRAYDRHSATGKTDSDKKIHQSWGGNDGNAELQVEEAATKDATLEKTGGEWGPAATDDAWGGPAAPADENWGGAPPAADDGWAAPAAGDATPAEGDKNEGRRGREKEVEEPDNTLTLDQYLQKQKEKSFSVPKLETRKANEGVDDALWKGVVELQKKDEEASYFIGKSKSTPKPRAKKEDKIFLEIDARFERPSRGGRGRGGDRGGGDRERGVRGRGRGDYRGGKGRSNGAPTLDVDDEKAFPSLS